MGETKEVETNHSDNKSPNQNDTKIENQPTNKSLARKEIEPNNLNSVNLFNPIELAAAENFLTKVMRSDKGGIKSVNDGLAILMRAKDLDLPFSTCIEHIHVINGKTGIDIHIIKALLSRAGCTWRCNKDYQPLYEYTDGFNIYVDGSFPEYVVRCINQEEAENKSKTDNDNIFVYPVKWYKDFAGNVYKDYQLNTTKFGIAINKAQAAEITKSNKTPVYRIPNQAVDYVTEYEIFRNVNGKEISAIGRFSFIDAQVAEMFSKDTYKKYPRILISHRAFTYAARDIASDILFGSTETTELKVMSGVELNSNDTNSVEDAEVVIID